MSQVVALQRELYSDVSSRSSKDEPAYETSHDKRVLGPYIREAVDRIKGYYRSRVGIVPSFENVKVSLDKLPIRRSRWTGRPDGVVHGLYEPSTGQAVYNIDSVEFAGLPDTPEKQELREYGLTEHPKSVVTHELVHHAQRETGMLRRYINKFWIFARHPIEGLTTEQTEEITGIRQTTYPHERRLARKLMGLYGKAKAILGDVPAGLSPRPAPAYALAAPRTRLSYSFL